VFPVDWFDHHSYRSSWSYEFDATNHGPPEAELLDVPPAPPARPSRPHQEVREEFLQIPLISHGTGLYVVAAKIRYDILIHLMS
jgi:hypothetical protein